MVKDVFLKLKSISYAGQSIGDDIRIEIEVLDKQLVRDIKLKHGSERELNLELGQFVVDPAMASLPVKIKVVEKDLVFDDVGASQIVVDVKDSDGKSKISQHTIEVKERERKIINRSALFELVWEVRVTAGVRYVLDHPKVTKGFLYVIKEDDGQLLSLPSALQVQVYEIREKREYFVIQEGIYQGAKASVKFDDNGSSFLSADSSQTAPTHLIYSLSKKILTLNSDHYKTDDDPTNKIPKGLYDIEIPDSYHSLSEPYLSKASLACMWFRISHDYSQSRYIHTGNFSAGCVTILEHSRWDSLCRRLMSGRKGDGMSVGTLEVID